MSENIPSPITGRVALLDELRGFFILLMVLYHGCYNLTEIFFLDFPFFYSPFMQFLQLLIAGDFILISGVACRFSRNNRKRGLQVFALGMVLTAVTAIVLPSQVVRFGVLHLLGVAMLLFSLVRPALDRLHPTVGLLLSTLLFLSTYFVSSGFLGFPPFILRIPAQLYSTGWLFWLGFPGPGFFSSDYFALLPWLFLFFAGSYAGVFLKSGRFPRWVYRPHCRWLAVVGRHTIWIYMVHQPLLYGAMLLIFRLLGQ